MPSLCEFSMCHNLGSSSYQGYCSQSHYEKGIEHERLFEIIKTHSTISTIKDARAHLALTLKEAQTHKQLTSSFHCFPKSEILEKRAKEDVFTSSFHCEVCKELLHE